VSDRPLSRRDDPTRESIPLWLVRHSFQVLLRLIFRLKITGTEHLPPDGPVLLAGNHSGFLDGPIVMIMLPRPSAFLVKSELYDGPLRRVLHFARQIPINRGTPDRTALRRGLEVLAGDGVLGVFPEGTRGAGDVTTIQHGIGYLALHARCPIVPVLCTGTAEALPKGHKLPRWRAPIEVVFGPAFNLDVPGDLRTRATIAAAAEQIRAHLADHLAAHSTASGAAGERRPA
jgi:1-acyl-sn-glycerol-3-phosphate acyltransferase